MVQLSNRQAKASKLVDCYARPPMHEMRILHQHWLYYVRQIIGKDVSMLSIQLQAKFLSLELKGAKVVVVQHVLHPRRQPSKKLPGRSKDLNYTGVTGYITHATSSSYYIMPDMMISADSPKHEQDVLQALNSRVVKLERDFCDLAIILPRMQQKYRIEQESKEEKQKSTEKSADMEKTESDAVNRDAVEDEEEEVVAEEEDVVEMVAISEKDDLIKSDDTSYSSGPMLMLYGKHLHPHAHVAAGMAAAAALASGNNNGNNAVLVGGSSLTMSLHKSVSSCATKLVLK